ncbi:hypothetical protein [Fulvivirga sp.]|uniref:hypothetical protein n=1 Tax=Fulvivirga sp. TaxID=1931237 RepID=UPI0032EB7374
MNNIKKKIAILGSTGSIVTQALDVIKSHQDKFEVGKSLTHRIGCPDFLMTGK